MDISWNYGLKHVKSKIRRMQRREDVIIRNELLDKNDTMRHSAYSHERKLYIWKREEQMDRPSVHEIKVRI